MFLHKCKKMYKNSFNRLTIVVSDIQKYIKFLKNLRVKKYRFHRTIEILYFKQLNLNIIIIPFDEKFWEHLPR